MNILLLLPISCDFGFVKVKAGTTPHSSLEQVMYHAVKRQNYSDILHNQNRQNLQKMGPMPSICPLGFFSN